MTHDLSEFSSQTLLERVFELEDGGDRAHCACLPGTEKCELDDAERILTELDDRNYGANYP